MRLKSYLYRIQSKWLQQAYNQHWTWPTYLLWPFSKIFELIVAVRYFFYRHHLLKSYRFAIPIIVVGNITVGGTGKTPFVIWLAAFLKEKGYRPGIVSRGTGVKKHKEQPHQVTQEDVASEVGDESVLLFQHTDCPIVIHRNRVKAIKHLLKLNNCNIIICDDGLQHYRLQRDFEIVLIDGTRRLGNNQLLPAGPLRESIQRLNRVDAIIVNESQEKDEYTMNLVPIELISCKNQHIKKKIADFKHQKIHAVAGIGNPNRFFDSLINSGLAIIPHVFPDHYHYESQDIYFEDELPVVMTQKDAVKCDQFVDERHWWLRITTIINEPCIEKLSHHFPGDDHA